MFNRIRRAVARTRRRYTPVGRHRCPLTPACPTAVPPVHSGQHRDPTDVLAGEETALVRPYVLTIEERAKRHAAAVPNDLLAYTWFTPAEAF